MANLIKINDEYKTWLADLKKRIRSSQIKAALRTNDAMIELYWSIGADIVERQAEAKWGSGVIPRLSEDLKKEFPNVSGFSVTNLKYMKQFYLFYVNTVPISQQVVDQLENVATSVISQQVVGQLVLVDESAGIRPQACIMIPWGHNIRIFTSAKSLEEAMFYMQQTIAGNWGRAELAKQIKENLYLKRGKAPNNFELLLPEPQSDLAAEITKDPYNFDFTGLTGTYIETELEDALTNNVTQFLIELGKGFAYVGRQIKLKVGRKTFKLDLLFYHTVLHCYIVVDLKTGDFDPKDVGQVGLYISAVNHQLKTETDNSTIGLLICKSKDNTVARYALESSSQPIGVSEYEIANAVPEEYKSSLPTIEEIEGELDASGSLFVNNLVSKNSSDKR